MKIQLFFYNFLLCFTSHLILVAQSLPTHPRTPKWYLQNDNGKIYEGTYRLDTNNPAFEIVAFYGKIEENLLKEQNSVFIRFYLPTSDSNYFLKVEEYRPFQFYWMEDKREKGQSGWNTFKNWNIKSYLAKYNIPQSNIAISVRIGEEREKSNRFSPVYVYNSNCCKKAKYYITKIRLGFSITSGKFWIYSGEFDRSIPNGIKPIVSGKLNKHSGGSILTIPISLKDLPMKDNWYTVKVELEDFRGPVLFHYSFYHQILP